MAIDGEKLLNLVSLTRILGSFRRFDHLAMSDAFVWIRILREKFALEIIRQGQAENFEEEAAASLGF